MADYKVHYTCNGTGRDTYININSGGFFSPFKTKEVPAVGSFVPQVRYKSPSPVIMPLGVHYKSDGSGRDSYIIQGEGGLAHNYRFIDANASFKQSLRQSIRRTRAYTKCGGHETGLGRQARVSLNDLQRDIFSESQLHFSPQVYKQQHILQKHQQALDNRLSQAKTVRQRV